MRIQMQTYRGGRIVGGRKAGFNVAKLNVQIPKESEQTKSKSKDKKQSINKRA